MGKDTSSGRWFELQEYAKGGSLKDWLPGHSSPEQALLFLKEIVPALQLLHSNQVLHLDLKPSNILLRSADPLDLILADFGISSLLNNEVSRKMTQVKGTPLYWAPESFTGVVGKEADWWSIGIILLEQLMGKHPFQDLDTRVIMFSLTTRPVPIPEDLPGGFTLLIQGLLTRDPMKRWGFDQVSRWLSGEKGIPVFYNAVTPEATYSRPFSCL